MSHQRPRLPSREVNEMDECLRLHKALSEAQVEYQQAFDERGRFLEGLNVISRPLETQAEGDRLELAVRNAFDKREAAQRAYDEYRQQQR